RAAEGAGARLRHPPELCASQGGSMKHDRTPEFSRRTLLKAAGATLCVPFFLKQAFAKAPATRPNLVLLMQTNGVNQASFWPKDSTFDSPILSRLLTDPAVGPKTTLERRL